MVVRVSSCGDGVKDRKYADNLAPGGQASVGVKPYHDPPPLLWQAAKQWAANNQCHSRDAQRQQSSRSTKGS